MIVSPEESDTVPLISVCADITPHSSMNRALKNSLLMFSIEFVFIG